MSNSYQLTQDTADSLADLYKAWIETGDYENVFSCRYSTGKTPKESKKDKKEDVTFTWESR